MPPVQLAVTFDTTALQMKADKNGQHTSGIELGRAESLAPHNKST